MEKREIHGNEQIWHPIVPVEGLPKNTDSWILKIPHIGDLSVNLEDKPGTNGYEDDNKVFILDPENSGMSINGEALYERGFKTLRLALTPNEQRDTQTVYLSKRGTKPLFESVLQSRGHGDGPLVDLTYWMPYSGEFEVRDIMLTRDQLADIQLNFPEEVNNL